MQIAESNAVFTQAVAYARTFLPQGKVANYIPELAKADASQLGICVVNQEGQLFAAGNFTTPFTMQSVGKVFALLMAQEIFGQEHVFTKVGMEPSGAGFSELTTLGEFSDKPSNPFINAGAIVLTSMLSSQVSFDEFLAFTRKLCRNPALAINERVYASETLHSDRNHSIAWELKRLNLLSNDLAESLDFYTKLCSVELTAADLARFGQLLANHGAVVGEASGDGVAAGERWLEAKHVTTALSLMFTCGLYNGTGSFAVQAGLPAKSGVGGGIVAVIPGKMGIGTFGPALDANGNSIGGMKILDFLSSKLGWHQFGPK